MHAVEQQGLYKHSPIVFPVLLFLVVVFKATSMQFNGFGLEKAQQ